MKIIRNGIEIESTTAIDKAIDYCYKLIDKYDDGAEIDDIDISYLIEILKGRE